MSALLSIMWFIIGIIWVVAGKEFLEVCACFLIAGIFMGVNELALMRQEMEGWDEADE